MDSATYHDIHQSCEGLKGIIALLDNIQDGPIEYLEPHQLAVLLRPLSNNLTRVLETHK